MLSCLVHLQRGQNSYGDSFANLKLIVVFVFVCVHQKLTLIKEARSLIRSHCVTKEDGASSWCPHTHTHSDARTRMHVHTHTNMHMHAYAHIHTNRQMHTCTHMHTHTHMHAHAVADPEIKKGEGARSKSYELFIRTRRLGRFRRFFGHCFAH